MRKLLGPWVYGYLGTPTRWTWAWVNSGSWWWTGRPGVLRFMGSQRVGHDWATELNWTEGHPGCFTAVSETKSVTSGLPGFFPESSSPILSCCYCLASRSCPTLVIPWTVACQPLLSMGFPRQEHWSGLLFPSPGDLTGPGNLTGPGIKTMSLYWQGSSLTLEPPGKRLS